MICLLFVVDSRARHGVQRYTDQEEQQERKGEGILVQLKHQSAASHRPGSVAPLALSGMTIHRLGLLRILRLRRALLKQERSQDHVTEHLEELALPVFRRCLPEVRAREVAQIPYLRLSV